MEFYHQNRINMFHLDTYIGDHFCNRLKWLVFQGKIVEFPDTKSTNNSVMTLDLLLKSTIARHPIGHTQNGDLCHDLRMYPIAATIRSHCQLLPTTVQAPAERFNTVHTAQFIVMLIWITHVFINSVLVDGKHGWNMCWQ